MWGDDEDPDEQRLTIPADTLPTLPTPVELDPTLAVTNCRCVAASGRDPTSTVRTASDSAVGGPVSREAGYSQASYSEASYRERVVISQPSSVTMTVCSFWLTRQPSSSVSTG